jgi:hypothetical protein
MGDFARCGGCGLMICDCPEGSLEGPPEPIVWTDETGRPAGPVIVVYPCRRCGNCDGNCHDAEEEWSTWSPTADDAGS